MDLGMENVIIHVGDVIEMLRKVPDSSVHCVVTSPPYWGLRHYGVEGQIGLEASPQAHIDLLVDVFREVRRVLRPDGTCWLNYGDCYSGSSMSGGVGSGTLDGSQHGNCKGADLRFKGPRTTPGLPGKNLLMLPARLALALQADGWWLRSEIIWAKGLSFCPSYSGSVMPESVKDRPINAHEKMYLLTKSPKYFYDAEAAREPAAAETSRAYFRASKYENNNAFKNSSELQPTGSGVMKNCTRSIRNVWAIGPQPLKANHFASFPEKLVEPCIMAGTSEYGCCSKCGAPWKRDLEFGDLKPISDDRKGKIYVSPYFDNLEDHGAGRSVRHASGMSYERRTSGFSPTCDCGGAAVPCTVLDPFMGSGTTALVASKMGRKAIGMEINPDYVQLAKDRLGAHAMGISLASYIEMRQSLTEGL